MTTGRDIVQRMLQKAGIVTKDESPAADELADGISALNAMVESWSCESAIVYATTKESFPLVSGVSEYTIGAGQDFDTARPIFINGAYVRDGNVDYQMSVVPDNMFLENIQYKASQGLPEYISYNNSSPTGVVRIFPTPSTSYTLFILSEKPTGTITADTVLQLPPGWERALIFNGAVEIGAEYGAQISQEIYEIAKQSKRNIKASALRNKTMDADPVYGGYRGNIYTGWSR